MKKIIIFLLCIHISNRGLCQDNITLNLIKGFIYNYKGTSTPDRDYGVAELRSRDQIEALNLLLDYINTLKEPNLIRNGLFLIGHLEIRKDTFSNHRVTNYLLDYMYHKNADVCSVARGCFERQPKYTFTTELKEKWVRLMFLNKDEHGIDVRHIRMFKLYGAIPLLQERLLNTYRLEGEPIIGSSYWDVSRCLYMLGDKNARTFCKNTLDSLYKVGGVENTSRVESEWRWIENEDAFDFFKQELIKCDENEMVGRYSETRCGTTYPHKKIDGILLSLRHMIKNLPEVYNTYTIDDSNRSSFKQWVLSQPKEKLIFENTMRE